jgi:hypothetical protein
MRTFYFTSLIEAARFIEAEGLPSIVTVLARNANGIATRCEVSAPADLFQQVAA